MMTQHPRSAAEPLVTVVIPVYNHEQYVCECIDSIIRQTYEDIELLIINDGSTDGSHEQVLTRLAQCEERFSRFQYINRENRGLSATLNQALAMCGGEYFSVLASDDAALPDKIAVLVDAFRGAGPSCTAIFGDALFIDAESQKVVQAADGSLVASDADGSSVRFLEYYTRKRQFDFRGDAFGTYRTLLEGNYLPAMSTLIKTKALVDAGGWTEGNPVEDWEMWLKLAKHSTLKYVDRPVALYRWHPVNSFKAMPTRYNYACLLLVKRERRFCAQNGLLPVWRQVSRLMAQHLFYDQKLAFSRRLRLLRMAGVGYVIRTKLEALRS